MIIPTIATALIILKALYHSRRGDDFGALSNVAYNLQLTTVWLAAAGCVAVTWIIYGAIVCDM